MKVDFKHNKGGRVQPMDERFAKILQGLNRGTYQTRHMVASSEQNTILGKKVTSVITDELLGEDNSDLDELDQAGLHALAGKLGVKLHPQTGAVKARAAIVEFRAGKK